MAGNTEEVSYHCLRPEQIVRRRNDCPVAYIPLGTIEWHGSHLPVGADTMQAEGLARLCAQRGGGLAFPPLWYGESRLESLMESGAEDKDEIAREMGLSPEKFGPDYQPFGVMEQTTAYSNLLIHMLAEAMSLGFKVGILVAGHYPLIDHARAAVLRFNKWRGSRRGGMLAWACLDYLPLSKEYENAGDHAGPWETSHMMHLHPELVDLDTLKRYPGNRPPGIMGPRNPGEATAAFGEETLVKAADWVIGQAKARLADPEYYRRHGCGLLEGR